MSHFPSRDVTFSVTCRYIFCHVPSHFLSRGVTFSVTCRHIFYHVTSHFLHDVTFHITRRDTIQVHELLLKANKNRTVAATKCNERSSRSHSVFRLKIEGKNTKNGKNDIIIIVAIALIINIVYVVA